MPQAVIGCDLSRAFIGTCDLPSGEIDRIANTPNGIDAWLATLDHDVRIIFEATSGCDGELIAALAARGHPFSRVKPRQAGEFARATGTLAKTDRVDARVLAQMGAALDLPVTIPLSSARARLADFLRRRRQLVDMRKAEKLHRHSAGQPEIVQAIETMIDLLGRQIATLDRQIAAFIAEDHALIEQAEFLRRFPASAPPSLLPCSANSPSSAPCAAERSPRSPASPPHARNSGTWRRARRIWGGRRKVREALYIAALNASGRIPVLTAMRDIMRAKGKSLKTILIAVARQLLVILNAMIRKRQPIALG